MQGGAACMRRQQPLNVRLRWYLERIERERRDAVPIDGDLAANGLPIAFDPRKRNLELGFLRQRVNVMAFRFSYATALVLLEGNNLERNAKYFVDFLTELAVV